MSKPKTFAQILGTVSKVNFLKSALARFLDTERKFVVPSSCKPDKLRETYAAWRVVDPKTSVVHITEGAGKIIAMSQAKGFVNAQVEAMREKFERLPFVTKKEENALDERLAEYSRFISKVVIPTAHGMLDAVNIKGKKQEAVVTKASEQLVLEAAA